MKPKNPQQIYVGMSTTHKLAPAQHPAPYENCSVRDHLIDAFNTAQSNGYGTKKLVHPMFNKYDTFILVMAKSKKNALTLTQFELAISAIASN